MNLWFVGKDVAVALGYKDTINALKAHVDEEDKRGWQITTQKGVRETTVINESGVYSLIFGSKLPSAKKFKHWVTSEVLPAIRKTGTYSKPKYKATRPLTSDDYVEAAKIVSKCTPVKLKIVLDLLEKGGFEVPQISNVAETLTKQRYIISDTVSEFFDNVEIDELVGTPTCEIYLNYVNHCTENDKVPISNIVFSKCVNSTFGTKCHVKKINGRSKRIFVFKGRKMR